MINQRYIKSLMTVSIVILPGMIGALNLHSSVLANPNPNNIINSSLDTAWQNATQTHSLISPTPINSLKFSPDGKTLVGVGGNLITTWNVETGEIQRILPGHYASKAQLKIAPTAIAFSPDSNFLATATLSKGSFIADHSLIVWDINTGEKVLNLTESDGCRQVLFDSEGKILYGVCGLGVTAWSFPTGEKLFSFANKTPIEAIAISSNREVMATTGVDLDNSIELWKLEQQQATWFKSLTGNANSIAQLEFTADDSKLVSSSYDGKINVWNWQTGATFPQTNNLYSSNGLFSLSADSRLLAGNFHSSLITDLNTGLPLRNLQRLSKDKNIQALVFSPQSDTLAKVTHNAIELWQTNTPKPQATPAAKDNYLPLNINQYWGNFEELGNGENMTLPTTKPSPYGKDPQAIALSALGLTNTVESETEYVQIDYPNDNLATVTITQTNLADDSLSGIRYLVEFAPYGEAKSQWHVIWAGKQFKCRLARGDQNWSLNLCQ